MTIYSGRTRISEEEDLWRIIGIHEVTTPLDEYDQEIIRGYMRSEDDIISFYSLLSPEYDIYYDLISKQYKYLNNDFYCPCTIIDGYYMPNGFYTTPLTLENNKIYYDEDTTKYYLYKDSSFQNVTKYTYTVNGVSSSTVYYYEGDGHLYKNKTNVSSDIISILVNDVYEQHPYIEGLLTHNIFYSNEIPYEEGDYIYYNLNDETYYLYNFENQIFEEATYEYISPIIDENNTVRCLPLSGDPENKTLVTGYKIGNRFFKEIAAGYTNAINPIADQNGNDTSCVYYDQITHGYYFYVDNEFVHMPLYEAYETHTNHDSSGVETTIELDNGYIVNNVLYYHNYENENELHHRYIVDGYFVDGSFYTTKKNGRPNAIYHVTGTDSYYVYNDTDNLFYSETLTGPYMIGIYYSGRVDPSINNFYQDDEGKLYYYDGSYHVTTTIDGYYVPTKNIMCQYKESPSVENNENLYYNILNESFYVYKSDDDTLVQVKPVSCYIVDHVAYTKQRPAIGATYYDINTEEYYIYKDGLFIELDNDNPPISNDSQIVLSLTKQDLLIDDNILDQNPYDQDVVLAGVTANKAGLMTADLYNRFLDLEHRYEMKVSSTTYNTLADLERAAPDDTNLVYIVGGSQQYVLSDNGDYVKIGDTDVSTLDLTDIASIDDVTDILEEIHQQDSRLQHQINILDTEVDSKYSTSNIITDINNLTETSEDAVSSKVLVNYIRSLMTTTINVDSLVTETVVERVEKYEDSIRVYYKDIVTAAPPAYIDNLSTQANISKVDPNHTFSARFIKLMIDDLQTQIDNITDDGLGFEWASNDQSNATIVLSINNRVVNYVP